ncbi:unnamed protein product, partial [Sphacelaria rigidula]
GERTGREWRGEDVFRWYTLLYDYGYFCLRVMLQKVLRSVSRSFQAWTNGCGNLLVCMTHAISHRQCRLHTTCFPRDGRILGTGFVSVSWDVCRHLYPLTYILMRVRDVNATAKGPRTTGIFFYRRNLVVIW